MSHSYLVNEFPNGLACLAATAALASIAIAFVRNRRHLARTRSLRWLVWFPGVLVPSLLAAVLLAAAIATFLGKGPDFPLVP